MTRAAEARGPGPMAPVAVEQRFPPTQRILINELADQMLPFSGRAPLAATAYPGRATTLRAWWTMPFPDSRPG